MLTHLLKLARARSRFCSCRVMLVRVPKKQKEGARRCASPEVSGAVKRRASPAAAPRCEETTRPRPATIPKKKRSAEEASEKEDLEKKKERAVRGGREDDEVFDARTVNARAVTIPKRPRPSSAAGDSARRRGADLFASGLQSSRASSPPPKPKPRPSARPIAHSVPDHSGSTSKPKAYASKPWHPPGERRSDDVGRRDEPVRAPRDGRRVLEQEEEWAAKERPSTLNKSPSQASGARGSEGCLT